MVMQIKLVVVVVVVVALFIFIFFPCFQQLFFSLTQFRSGSHCSMNFD